MLSSDTEDYRYLMVLEKVSVQHQESDDFLMQCRDLHL